MSDLFFYLLPFIVGGALSGIFFGLLPFYLSLKRRRPLLGVFALAVCVACGIVLGAILAFPIATSFAAAILLTEKRAPKPKAEPMPAFTEKRKAKTLV
ncbi:MAG: hypothetical protein AAFQ95_19500 [Cyanobacteria bacterium J06621_3]